MPEFSYEARRGDGEVVHGHLEAESKAAARSQLEADGLTVLTIGLALERAEDAPDARASGGRAANGEERSAGDAETGTASADAVERDFQQRHLPEQVARILATGRPLAPALRSYADELPPGRYRRQLRTMADVLAGRADADQSLAAGEIPRRWIPLLCAASRAGDPRLVLREFLAETERTRNARGRILASLIYPFAVAAVVLLIAAIFCALVVPVFEMLFADYGMQLPTSTRLILNWSEAIRSTRGAVVAGLVLLVVGVPALLYLLLPFDARVWVHDHLPLIGRGLQLSTAARFTRYLADLLDAGVPLPDALRVAGQSTGRPTVLDAADRLATDVDSADQPWAEAELADSVPAVVLFALRQQKAPGVTARLLRELSITFELQARNRLTWVHGFVEPISICLVAGLAGFLFVALVAPLVSLVQNLQ